MRVELVSPHHHSPHTGIGRYLHTMVRFLAASVDIGINCPRFLPLAERLSPLKNLPIGIRDHRPGSIVHFAQIMGCAMMLYRPHHPSLATVHDLGFLELPEEWGMFDPVARQMLRLSLAGLKRADRIVADSEFTRQGIIEHLEIRKERVVKVYPGIDGELFRPISDARRKLTGHYPRLGAIASAPWLLYVGSDLPRKNLRTLLQAVALVREEMADVRLIKVGSAGGERFRRETLKTIGALELMEHVLFFEGVPEEMLPLFYGAADVFVTASRLEGFGFPVLEAMACGTPVVCSNAGALREVAGDVGLLFEPRDAPGFADAIVAILRDADLGHRLLENGLQRCRSFSWGRTAQATLAVYSEMMDG